MARTPQFRERPTSHAFRDLQKADGEWVHRDTTSGAVVVVGRKGRVHLSGTGSWSRAFTSVNRILNGAWWMDAGAPSSAHVSSMEEQIRLNNPEAQED